MYPNILKIEKGFFETGIEKILAGSLERWHLSHDRSVVEGKIPLKSSHVIIYGFILLAMSIIILVFIPCRIRYGNLLLFAIVSYVLYLPIQYYITPMFTNIPGLFRYIWFYLVPMWCIVFLGIAVLLLSVEKHGLYRCESSFLSRSYIIIKVLVCIVLIGCSCNIFSPLFLSPRSAYAELASYSKSPVGWVILGMKNTGTQFFTYISDFKRDSNMSNFLRKRALMN